MPRFLEPADISIAVISSRAYILIRTNSDCYEQVKVILRGLQEYACLPIIFCTELPTNPEYFFGSGRVAVAEKEPETNSNCNKFLIPAYEWGICETEHLNALGKELVETFLSFGSLGCKFTIKFFPEPEKVDHGFSGGIKHFEIPLEKLMQHLREKPNTPE